MNHWSLSSSVVPVLPATGKLAEFQGARPPVPCGPVVTRCIRRLMIVAVSGVMTRRGVVSRSRMGLPSASSTRV